MLHIHSCFWLHKLPDRKKHFCKQSPSDFDCNHFLRDCWRFANSWCLVINADKLPISCHQSESLSVSTDQQDLNLVVFWLIYYSTVKIELLWNWTFCLCRLQQICDFCWFITVSCCIIRNSDSGWYQSGNIYSLAGFSDSAGMLDNCILQQK